MICHAYTGNSILPSSHHHYYVLIAVLHLLAVVHQNILSDHSSTHEQTCNE